MSEWNSLQIKFDPLAPLEPPLKSMLTVLETVEAVLEAVLAIVKAFLIDLSNPLNAIIALLLAAVRTIINQLKSTGFSILLVHPDFSQPDFGAVLQSVSGAYPTFENKVISKFYDTSDIFRPTYPDGSSVAMFVFYIGADSPGDLMSQLFALLNLIKHPLILTGLPAPVNLKARPVNQNGSAISRLKYLFESDMDKALQLEWQMPMSPAGGNAPGFVNSLASFYQAFKFPNFVIERSIKPQGEEVVRDLKTQVAGPVIMNLQQRFQFAKPDTTTVVRETSGSPLKHFEKKFPVSAESGLLEGQLTGTYRFLDTNFTDEDRGKNFYYRVRAYFGNPSNYINAVSVDSYEVKSDTHSKIIYDFGNGVTMGNPSTIVRGFVPRALSSSSDTWNMYNDIYEAVKAGLLLNFEFPRTTSSQLADEANLGSDAPSVPSDDSRRIEQKTGWGTLSVAGGQIAALKSAYKTSDKLKEAFLFKATARRIANQCASALYSNPALADLVESKWREGAEEATNRVMNSTITWSFIGITSGITPSATIKINQYLDKEFNSSNYQPGFPSVDGPFPLSITSLDSGSEVLGLSADGREKLADFLRVALISTSGSSKYLSWYSVTIGDIAPAFVPFIFDFEQYILALLKAVQSALKEIEDIIQTIISKIQQLEGILESILALIELLNINVSVSVLATVNTSGSAQSLAETIMTSENKPDSSPFGLHSGMVLTAGGPGEGALAALKALAFIFQIPLK